MSASPQAAAGVELTCPGTGLPVTLPAGLVSEGPACCSVGHPGLGTQIKVIPPPGLGVGAALGVRRESSSQPAFALVFREEGSRRLLSPSSARVREMLRHTDVEVMSSFCY